MGGGRVFLGIGDRAVFLLVIWWFVPEKIGDLVILRSCGDGDFPTFCLVIWWLVAEKSGDLVILRSCGDGDWAIFVGDLVISSDLKQDQKGAENISQREGRNGRFTKK